MKATLRLQKAKHGQTFADTSPFRVFCYDVKLTVLFIVIVASLAGETFLLAGCSQPPAKATTLINSAAIVPMAAKMPSGLLISNINGFVYGWTNGVLAFSHEQVFTGVGGTWTQIPLDAFGHVNISQPNQIIIVQENYTALSVGITYATSVWGTNVYVLERSSDLKNWFVVTSQDSPQTNSWPANLIVDEQPDSTMCFYRVSVL